MTDFPTLLYTSGSEIPTLLYTLSLKNVPLLGRASPYRPLQGVPPPQGGYSVIHWIGVCHWDTDTLTLSLTVISLILQLYTRLCIKDPYSIADKLFSMQKLYHHLDPQHTLPKTIYGFPFQLIYKTLGKVT